MKGIFLVTFSLHSAETPPIYGVSPAKSLSEDPLAGPILLPVLGGLGLLSPPLPAVGVRFCTSILVSLVSMVAWGSSVLLPSLRDRLAVLICGLYSTVSWTFTLTLTLSGFKLNHNQC